jgi:hypothetical protein
LVLRAVKRFRGSVPDVGDVVTVVGYGLRPVAILTTVA